jgi:signal transduction histidine kinase
VGARSSAGVSTAGHPSGAVAIVREDDAAGAARGYRPVVSTQLSPRFGRHAVTVLAGCFALGALVELLVSPTVTIGTASYDRGPDAVLVLALATVVALVALRDRLGVLALVSAVAVLGLTAVPAPAWVLDSGFVYLLAMFTCGLGGYLTRTPVGHVGGVLVLVAVATLVTWRRPEHGFGQWLSVIAFMSIAWAAGTLVRGPVTRARTAEEHAEQLQQEQAEAARQAVLQERRRIAIELHDIVAHSVSVMTVQAGAVRRRLTADQAREHEALVAVERTGREALADMRRLVGLLQDGDAGPDYAPQPGLDALDSLLDNVRAAGLPVDLQVEGTRRELPPGVDLTAYRLVQEALTNTVKYAGPARSWVRVRWAGDELRIEVANNGHNTEPGTGYGHAGMRERVRLYGGRLESGPGADGGYVVRATLPIGPEA